VRVFLLACAALTIAMLGKANARAPSPADGAVYVATYVEVMPTSAAVTRTTLQRYREASSKAAGNLRCELLQRLGEPHQFVILEIWSDRAAAAAHGRSSVATQTRDSIAATRNAPIDERVHTLLSTATGALYDERKYQTVD
jgi:quinol monooxygenase YgiN